MNHEIHEPRRNTKVHEEVMTKAFLRETSCPSWFKIQMAATQSRFPGTYRFATIPKESAPSNTYG